MVRVSSVAIQIFQVMNIVFNNRAWEKGDNQVDKEKEGVRTQERSSGSRPTGPC